jgi:hypothetical protein
LHFGVAANLDLKENGGLLRSTHCVFKVTEKQVNFNSSIPRPSQNEIPTGKAVFFLDIEHTIGLTKRRMREKAIPLTS